MGKTFIDECVEWLVENHFKHFLRTERTNEVISIPNCPGLILYALFTLFYATRTRLCDYMKHVLLAKHFTPITVCKGVGVLIPHKRSLLKKIPLPAIFFPYRFPESLFCFHKQKTNKAHFIVWFERWQNSTHARLIRICSSNVWFPEFTTYKQNHPAPCA